MGQPRKLPVVIADERAGLALHALEDALADGKVDDHEAPVLLAFLRDVKAGTHAARESFAAGLAFLRGVQDVSYQNERVASYRMAFDELPPAA